MLVPDFTASGLFCGTLFVLDPPARLAVIGDPVAHSKSPGFHNAALRVCGIDAQYVRIRVTAEEFPDVLKALPGAGFIGANVTIPHKAAALAGVDEADDYSREAGAVNTIVVDGRKLIGFNTDGPGIVRAIRDEFSAEIRDLRVMILGAGGGAGRAIAVQCARERCKSLVLVNRTFEKARDLAQELARYFPTNGHEASGTRITAIPNEITALQQHVSGIDLVINASSLGMMPADPPALPASLLTPGLMIYDTVYAIGKSPLIRDAEAVGARAAGGLSMLLHQGALSFEQWFKRPAPLGAMRAALMLPG